MAILKVEVVMGTEHIGRDHRSEVAAMLHVIGSEISVNVTTFASKLHINSVLASYSKNKLEFSLKFQTEF